MAIADQDGSLEPWAPRWPPPCPESSGSVPGHQHRPQPYPSKTGLSTNGILGWGNAGL